MADIVDAIISDDKKLPRGREKVGLMQLSWTDVEKTEDKKAGTR